MAGRVCEPSKFVVVVVCVSRSTLKCVSDRFDEISASVIVGICQYLTVIPKVGLDTANLIVGPSLTEFASLRVGKRLAQRIVSPGF